VEAGGGHLVRLDRTFHFAGRPGGYVFAYCQKFLIAEDRRGYFPEPVGNHSRPRCGPVARLTVSSNASGRPAPPGPGHRQRREARPRMSLNPLRTSRQRGANSIIEQETIRAVVLAYAKEKGGIALPKLPPKTNHVRYAPSFRVAKEGFNGIKTFVTVHSI